MLLNFRTKHTSVILVTVMCLGIILQSCQKKHVQTDLAKESIIPKPASLTATNSSFELNGETVITVAGGEEVTRIGEYLSAELKKATGLDIKVKSAERPDDGSIHLALSTANKSIGDEGYDLSVTEDAATISANRPTGIFYGVQTLLQVVPLPSAEAKSDQIYLPTGTISDYPTYAWRGSMLDVARHFFSVEDVKR
jgi:hexosaminidase